MCLFVVVSPVTRALVVPFLVVELGGCASTTPPGKAPTSRPSEARGPPEHRHHQVPSAQPFVKQTQGDPKGNDGRLVHQPEDPTEHEAGMTSVVAEIDATDVIVTLNHPIVFNLGYGDLFVLEPGGIIREDMCSWESTFPEASCEQGVRSMECAMKDLSDFLASGGLRLVTAAGSFMPGVVKVEEVTIPGPLADTVDASHCGGGPHHLTSPLSWYGVDMGPSSPGPICDPEPLPGGAETWPRAVFYRPPVILKLRVTPGDGLELADLQAVEVDFPGLEHPYQDRPEGVPVYGDGDYSPNMTPLCRTTRLPEGLEASVTAPVQWTK